MTIKIEIISQKSVTKPTKTPGKTYTALDIAYKNLSFQGKVEGRQIMSFGATAATFKELSTANAGDVYDIEIVKNSNGYNDWVSAKKSTASSGGAAPATGQQQSYSGTGTPVRTNTYETPEERAQKQVYIVRQSSISSAIALLGAGAKSPPKVADVISTAKELEAYVFGKDQEADLKEGLSIEDIADSVIE